MTKEIKDMIMLQILPSIIKKETNPTDAVWYACKVIAELERKGYFENEQ